MHNSPNLDARFRARRRSSLVLLSTVMAIAGCSARVDPAERYRAAYIDCEHEAQRDSASGPTMSARVEKRDALMRACLSRRGH